MKGLEPHLKHRFIYDASTMEEALKHHRGSTCTLGHHSFTVAPHHAEKDELVTIATSLLPTSKSHFNDHVVARG